jgi:hypothetical protein
MILTEQLPKSIKLMDNIEGIELISSKKNTLVAKVRSC